MNLSAYFAKKYLVSKSSSQAIHWITGISILGISIGTAALIIVLSVFNGFEFLLSSLFSKHNPDIKIVREGGQLFLDDDQMMSRIKQLKDIKLVSKSLDQICMFQYNESQDFGTIKGIDSNFRQVILLDSALVDGSLARLIENPYFAIVGVGVKNKLGISLENILEDISVYVPKLGEAIDELSKSKFKEYQIRPEAIFSLNQESDGEYIYTDLSVLQSFIGDQKWISSIELKLIEQADIKLLKKELEVICGKDFLIKDRYMQDESFLRIMNLEKWLFFLLFSLTLILVSFTVVGSLWMIVLEKRIDISILKSLGMLNRDIRRIFIFVGLGIGILGLILGFGMAIGFYFLQDRYALIGVPDEFIIDSYPISLKFMDFIIVSVTVLSIVFLASLLPAQKIKEVKSIFREE
ncbi:MAG: FtsX-like permease family protein [Saprospiraceae bacterium]|nr:FtsX-like permease family protein [Candidatus Defluviibacterium haderslevense]